MYKRWPYGYVEFASSPVHNLGAVEDVLRHMLECDCGYVGINFPIDYCEECGYTGIIDSDYCPVWERTLTQKYCRETCCTE
ncbi:MAG: anaerobic ribonucleoside-triphosphate reductase [Phascolarctobacterium faecium]